VVDYAGLFPPASLEMTAAVTEYADHRNGPDAWALGRFVLPAARLDEFEKSAESEMPREGWKSWALSALLGTDLEQDIDRIEAFNERHRDVRHGAVHVDTVELKTHTPRDVSRASELLDRRFDTYMEIPIADDPAELVDAIADTTAKAKMRTGGVTADAIPASAHVVRFIERCVVHDVGFKATAGLHHPWRAEYPLTYASDAPRATMFGFLNVLLATAAVHAGRASESAAALLDERDPTAVRFVDGGIVWRDVTIPADAIVRARESMASFGSCSFEEPMTGLRQAHLL